MLEIYYGIEDGDPDLERSSRKEGNAAGGLLNQGPGNGGGGGEGGPPMVANMPEIIKLNPLLPAPLPKIDAWELDSIVCPNSPHGGCAFLVPAWLGEQETKAQLHLYQLGLIALALNRTLVLPNVAKSRLSTCFTQPFSFYYAEDALENLGIKTISQSDFLDWSERRDPPASAQVVSMVSSKSAYVKGAIEIDSASDPTLVPNKPSRKLCLSAPKTKLDFSSHSPLAIYPPNGYHKTESGRISFGESVVNTLKSEDVSLKSSRISSSQRSSSSSLLPNVLAFNYELRFPIMTSAVVAHFVPSLTDDPPLPFAHFPYSETWLDIGTTIAENLSPFIAIHWRTETLLPGNLLPCASSLIKKLIRLKKAYPEIDNVYFATDYPIETLEEGGGDVEARSGTFGKVVTEQHHIAFRFFLKEFKKQAKGLRLTSFSKEYPSLTLPLSLLELLSPNSTDPDSPSPPPLSISSLDSGLIGIIDKTVLTHAEIFLTGFPALGSGPNSLNSREAQQACAKISSFTNQIVGARGEVLMVEREVEEGEEEEDEEERKAGRLWNKVSRWSIGGGVDDDD